MVDTVDKCHKVGQWKVDMIDEDTESMEEMVERFFNVGQWKDAMRENSRCGRLLI